MYEIKSISAPNDIPRTKAAAFKRQSKSNPVSGLSLPKMGTFAAAGGDCPLFSQDRTQRGNGFGRGL